MNNKIQKPACNWNTIKNLVIPTHVATCSNIITKPISVVDFIAQDFYIKGSSPDTFFHQKHKNKKVWLCEIISHGTQTHTYTSTHMHKIHTHKTHTDAHAQVCTCVW